MNLTCLWCLADDLRATLSRRLFLPVAGTTLQDLLSIETVAMCTTQSIGGYSYICRSRLRAHEAAMAGRLEGQLSIRNFWLDPSFTLASLAVNVRLSSLDELH
jgi:hypothetical protein